MSNYLNAYKKAFPYTIPVLTGYLFIGIAFGVMFEEKGYSVWWAAFMSLITLAGAGQYLAVNFFIPGFSLVQIAFMTLMVNIRHIFYGLSLFDKFHGIGKKRWYMIYTLTDETYSLLCTTKIPEDIDKGKFLFAIASLDHSYWVIGTAIGALAGTYIPFNSQGIDFAMTALFVVIFVEQALEKRNRLPQAIGVACAGIALIIFGANNFVLPAMLAIITFLLLGNKKIRLEEEK